MACQSWASPASSLGGKNSNENDRSPSRMRRPMPCWVVCTMRNRIGGRGGAASVVPRGVWGRTPGDYARLVTSETLDEQFDSALFRERVQHVLDDFVDEQALRLTPLGPDAAALVAEAHRSVSGGKRFRAAFCYWGFRAVAPVGPEQEPALLRACAALELLHASALVHDDYMDASDTRRGRPATHRAFEAAHREAGWRGSPTQYGAAAAILLGDLL